MKKGQRLITDQQVIDILKREGIATANTIARETGHHYYTARKKLKDLVENGIVSRSSFSYPGRKYTLAVYRLIDGVGDVGVSWVEDDSC